MKGSELNQYTVTGRRLPSDKVPEPPVYKMTIFAPNDVVAKSRFFYFLSQLKKLKRSHGEILSVSQVFDSKTQIRNFGIWLRYDSRSGTHNMYREYRDINLPAAVTACYRDMASRHQVRARSLQIIRTDVIPAKDTRRPSVQRFHDSKIKFPLPHRQLKSTIKSKFVANRPTTFYG
eukprot:m.476381 g.476381  ORF g.476381 m.476381 type:complete len:176 (-) comp20513_c0_seq1:51-578(-)